MAETQSWETRFEGVTAKDVDDDGVVVEKPLVLTLPQVVALKGFITEEVTQAKIEQLVWVLKQIPAEGNAWLTEVRAGLEKLIVEFSGKGMTPTK